MNQFQDMTEAADADAVVDVEEIQVLYLVAATAVYGLFFFSSSAADAVAILSAVTVAAATTAVYGLFFFSSSAADAAIIQTATTIVDATIAAANKRNFEDGFDRPFCMHFSVIKTTNHSYKFTTIQKECLWNKNPLCL